MAYWSQQDLERLCGAATVLACCDDDNTGAPDQGVIAELQEFSDATVDGRMAAQNPTAKFPLTTPPPLVRKASLLLAKAMMYDRRPEYVRIYGTGPQAAADKFLDDMMEKPLYLEQANPDVIPPQPATVTGGVAVDGSVRMYIPNADGSTNAGDYVRLLTVDDATVHWTHDEFMWRGRMR